MHNFTKILFVAATLFNTVTMTAGPVSMIAKTAIKTSSKTALRKSVPKTIGPASAKIAKSGVKQAVKQSAAKVKWYEKVMTGSGKIIKKCPAKTIVAVGTGAGIVITAKGAADAMRIVSKDASHTIAVSAILPISLIIAGFLGITGVRFWRWSKSKASNENK